jgi:hypothetical protein
MEGKEENLMWKNISGLNMTKTLTDVTAGIVISRELSSAAAVLLVMKFSPPSFTFTTSSCFKYDTFS